MERPENKNIAGELIHLPALPKKSADARWLLAGLRRRLGNKRLRIAIGVQHNPILVKISCDDLKLPVPRGYLHLLIGQYVQLLHQLGQRKEGWPGVPAVAVPPKLAHLAAGS